MKGCADQKAILARLSRIEGQMRGIRSMVEEDRACEEIIIQLSAVSSAVASVAKEILYGHISHCVVEGIKQGDEEEAVKNLQKVLEQFVKIK